MVLGNSTATVASISLAGVTSILAILLTLFLIYRHLKHWANPVAQTYIVRILLMVPVYSVASWFSLLFVRQTIYFNLVRDCYESFVLYQFLSLLIHYFEVNMGNEVEEDNDNANAAVYLTYFDEHEHPFPCCCLPLIKPGRNFLYAVKECVMQYAFIKPALSIIAIILESCDLYHEGSISWRYGYMWITLIANISMTLSIYYLILFFDTIVEVIEEYKPLYKLLAIKLLLFFIFWQTLAIDTLYYFELIPQFLLVAEHDILNNILVCLEMFILSIANLWIFHYADYRDGNNYLGKALHSLSTSVFNPIDIMRDTKDVIIDQ